MGEFITSNSSFRPSHQPSTNYSRSTFGPNGTSPPTPSFRSDIFAQASAISSSQIYSTSPTAERHPSERIGIMPALAASNSDPSAFGVDGRPAPAVVIRRLPRTIGPEALRSMLIFAGDLIDTEFIRSPYPEDQGFATAVARFQTPAGAFEAQQKLNGKPNTTKEANMIVEAHSGGAAGHFERRNTIDGIASRTQTSSASSASSNGGPGRSRFGSTFQSTEKISPPLPNSTSAGDFPVPESSAHFQNLFSPQSPLANGDHRVSGKSMINDDSVDDETGELLKDPVAYAKSGQQPLSRRPTNSSIPLGRFASLSLSSPSGVGNNMMQMSANGFTSPRGTSVQNGNSPMSPTNGAGMTNGAYAPPNFPRPQYPPVNPADQNPPCNTLYVGNLPIDTSEDELKGLFSKQRGYKRLCFRTKQNGPMCFVEFEDISFATKALHELYGHPLHNSVKGGIRLSFSKNPLGVRSGQTNGMGASAVMSPQAMAPGYGTPMNGSNYSSVSGPPPGLGSPPGLMNGNAPSLINGNGALMTGNGLTLMNGSSGLMNGNAPSQMNGNSGYRPQTAAGVDGMFANPFGMSSPDFLGQIAPRNYSGGVPPALGSGTYGRDNRNGYTEYSDYPDYPDYSNGPKGSHGR